MTALVLSDLARSLLGDRVSVFWRCFAACVQGCSDGRLYVCIICFSLCVKQDESINTCFLGGGGGWLQTIWHSKHLIGLIHRNVTLRSKLHILCCVLETRSQCALCFSTGDSVESTSRVPVRAEWCQQPAVNSLLVPEDDLASPVSCLFGGKFNRIIIIHLCHSPGSQTNSSSLPAFIATSPCTAIQLGLYEVALGTPKHFTRPDGTAIVSYVCNSSTQHLQGSLRAQRALQSLKDIH